MGGINIEHKLSFFAGVAIDSIVDLMPISDSAIANGYVDLENFRQILQLNLSEPSKPNVLDAIEILEKIDGIKYVGANSLIVNEYDISATQSSSIAAETLSSISEITTTSNQDEQWALFGDYGIDIESAWDRTTGDSSITVGVINSGISEETDLIANLNVEIGYDYSSIYEGTTDDYSGNGTHVAGIIGATSSSDDGIYGVAKNVSLVPIQAFYCTTNYDNEILEITTEYILVAAIEWAISNDIDILCMGFGYSDEIDIIKTAISSYSGLLVCGAGYDKDNVTTAGDPILDIDQTAYYPACYSQGETFSYRVISVGAYDSNGNISSFSNYGSTTVSIFAPGEDIISTVPTSTSETGYAYKSGTSQAAAYVAGVAVLLMAYNPTLTVDEVKSAIVNSAVYDANFDGLCVSNGRLNAYKALCYVDPAVAIFDDFGYTGSTYSWLGELYLECSAYEASITSFDTRVMDPTWLYFELYTTSSYNYDTAISGTIEVEMIDDEDNVVRSSSTTVDISANNEVSFGTDNFMWSTSGLDNAIYSLELTYSFTRGSTTYTNTLFYMIIITQPVEVMDGFGHNDSWYKWNGALDINTTSLKYYSESSMENFVITSDMDFIFSLDTDFVYNAWNGITGNISIVLTNSSGEVIQIEGNDAHTSSVAVSILSTVSFSNRTFTISSGDLENDVYTLTLTCNTARDGTTYATSGTFSFEVAIEESCVAEGSLITLADGSQVAVETLTGDEELLVWNMFTGEFDTASILFIDSDAIASYEIIELTFSDGTTVKVIDEHGFWNATLNEYVFLDSNADAYIGDYFNKQTYDADGNMIYTTVQLVSVDIYEETTTAWSPVTYSYLCYYVNGMLSMPGGTTSLINIFDVDADTMTIDMESYNADIAEYGLFTYEEFAEIMPVFEYVFDAFNAQYFKVAMGKGILTWDDLATLFETYQDFLG